MARGRHRRRSGLLSRLWPVRRRIPVEVELARVRALAEASAATASAALVRASAAEDRALRAEHELMAGRRELAAMRAELAAVRAEVVGLREELVWAFAEGRMPVAAATPAQPPAVIDLRDTGARPA